jgi:hypothetical protein
MTHLSICATANQVTRVYLHVLMQAPHRHYPEPLWVLKDRWQWRLITRLLLLLLLLLLYTAAATTAVIELREWWHSITCSSASLCACSVCRHMSICSYVLLLKHCSMLQSVPSRWWITQSHVFAASTAATLWCRSV